MCIVAASRGSLSKCEQVLHYTSKASIDLPSSLIVILCYVSADFRFQLLTCFDDVEVLNHGSLVPHPRRMNVPTSPRQAGRQRDRAAAQ